jgi:radical SAM protein with 4Fe4S-binding SPASM domain
MNKDVSETLFRYTGTADSKVQMYGKEDFLTLLYEKFGERFLRYRAEWDRAGQGDGYLPDFPLFLDVEPEYRCNLRCVTCPLKDGKDNPSYIQDRMSVDVYRRICEEGKKHGLPAITVSNNNEGLLQKNLFGYIQAAQEAGIMDIFVGTNAHLLKREMGAKLIKSGLSRLLISIDAATAETYLKVRKSDKYEMVVKNVLEFHRLRAETGSRLPLIRVSMVVTSLNQHEEQRFRDFWAEYADIISIQRYIPYQGDPHIQDELIPEGRDPLDFTVCAPLWQRMTIRANGDVIACCHLSNKLGIGNINESSIHDIWHGERMDEIRRIHLAGKYQEIDVCKSCMS